MLTMEEVMDLRLDADWVVMSACNTAAAEGRGAEAFTGLSRAFFYAGTRAILASHWSVETTSARELTTGLFEYQADYPEASRATALHKTMLGLIDDRALLDPATGNQVLSYAHPVFWAPFTLIGEGANLTK